MLSNLYIIQHQYNGEKNSLKAGNVSGK